MDDATEPTEACEGDDGPAVACEDKDGADAVPASAERQEEQELAPAVREAESANEGGVEEAVESIPTCDEPQTSRHEEPTAVDSTESFVIRNLDTGEAITIPLGGGKQEQALAPDLIRQQLSFSTVSKAPGTWESLKQGSRGHVEKLASHTSLSLGTYQLCVWQERYMYAEDDALCYQHLSAEMMPVGDPKRILYSSIEFVGPFDDTQFVLKCERRSYTFLCDSTESQGFRWK